MTATTATAPPEHPPLTRRDHLDGLRTVAVYLVVLFHAGADRFQGGYIGVDLFFVLSGFLVTHVILADLWGPEGRLSLRTFYARRVRRLLPAAVVTLLVTAVLYSMVASPAEARDSVDSFLAAFLYVSNWHFIRESSDYFAADVSTNPVLHFWSLSIEEQFYFVWPPLLVGLTVLRRRVRNGDLVVRTIVLVTALASAAWALHLSQSNMSRAYYGSDSRAYQLLAGALLAMSPALAATRTRSGRQLLGTRLAAAVSAAAVLGLLLLSTSLVGFGPVVRGFLTTALVIALLISLELSGERSPVRWILSTAPITYLGRISYGTYLWHWPVIVVLSRVLPASPLTTAAITFGVATGLAALSAELLEMPIRTSRSLQRIPRTVAIGGVAASVVLGLTIIPPILESDTGGATTVATSEGNASTGSTSIDDVDWQFAADDHAEATGCTGKPVSTCAVGPQTGPRVLLIGDSHGVMLRPTMEEIAGRRGYALSAAAVNGCSWHLGLAWAGATPEKQQECFDVQRDWYGRILTEIEPELVVVIQRAIDDPDRPMEFVGDGPELQGLSQTELVAKTAENSLAAFREAGVPVAIVESIPVTGNDRDPITCLSTAERVEQCRYVAQLATTPVERLYRESAGEGIRSVNIDKLVCPYLPICDPVVNGIVVKWDSTHLTATFARSISSDLERALDDAGLLP